MTLDELKQLGPELSLRPGASEEAIAQSETALGIRFPDDYREFLKTSNGAVGFVASGDYIDLWPIEQLPLNYKAYAFEEYCPAFVPFGSNGAAEAMVFRRTDLRVMMRDLLSLSIVDVLDIAPSFTQFMSKPRPQHWP